MSGRRNREASGRGWWRAVPPALLLLLAAACGSDDDEPSVRLGEEQSGIATYYSATGAGACSFDPTGDLLVAALNADQYDGAAYCGACAEVEGPTGSVTVRIVDLCPECEEGHLDLSREAFAEIAPLERGRVDITWRLVACPVTGNLRFRFKEGSSRWWTALQVRDHRLPVQSLERRKGQAWVPMERQDYNYFVEDEDVGDGPLTVRVTAMGGEALEETLPPVQEGLVVEGQGQFRAP